MMQEIIKMGTIFEVPLGNNLGFGYVKVIDSIQLNSWGWLVYIYDLNRTEVWGKKNIDEFNQIDFLTSPMLGIQNPPQRGLNKWKKLGVLPLLNEELLLPEFKAYLGNKPEINKWGVTIGCSMQYASNYGEYDFDQVKHIGNYRFIPMSLIVHRITMEWMRKLNLDYNEYTHDDAPLSFIEEQIVHINTTMLYNEVPKSIRNRVQG